MIASAAASAPSDGTMPAGRKIMNTIMISAEHDVLVVVEHGEHLRQQHQHGRADDAAEDRAEAAEHRHGDELDRAQEARRVRRHETVEQREIRARDRRIDRRQHERDQLVARDVDAEHARSGLAVVDGAEARGRSGCRSG